MTTKLIISSFTRFHKGLYEQQGVMLRDQDIADVRVSSPFENELPHQWDKVIAEAKPKEVARIETDAEEFWSAYLGGVRVSKSTSRRKGKGMANSQKLVIFTEVFPFRGQVAQDALRIHTDGSLVQVLRAKADTAEQLPDVWNLFIAEFQPDVVEQHEGSRSSYNVLEWNKGV